MTPLAKVDAHHHLWTVASPHHPMMRAAGADRFYGSTDALKHDFDAATFARLARRRNVVKSVYVESGYHPAADEVAAVQAIADAHGFPHAILGRIDPRSPDVERELDGHGRAANFRGVRLSVNWSPDARFATAPQDGLMRDGDWRRGYAALGERGLVADLMMLPHQMGDAADLAADFPQVQMIVNHAGLPTPAAGEGMQAWRQGMARLAGCANVAVKISGLGMVMHDWTAERLAPIVDVAIDLFGADRCMFASNFPVDGLHATWDQVWDAFDAVTAHRPSAERIGLFHDNAVRLYRL